MDTESERDNYIQKKIYLSQKYPGTEAEQSREETPRLEDLAKLRKKKCKFIKNLRVWQAKEKGRMPLKITMENFRGTTLKEGKRKKQLQLKKFVLHKHKTIKGNYFDDCLVEPTHHRDEWWGDGFINNIRLLILLCDLSIQPHIHSLKDLLPPVCQRKHIFLFFSSIDSP